jgi:hypothetical protein
VSTVQSDPIVASAVAAQGIGNEKPVGQIKLNKEGKASGGPWARLAEVHCS